MDTTPDNVFSCVVCHTLPIGSGSTGLLTLTNTNNPPSFSVTSIPPSTNGSQHLGIVAIDGTGQTQIKVAALRNQIDKEGFFLNLGPSSPPSRAGFGVLHDGSIDGVFRFLAENAFDMNTVQDLANVVAFTLCVRGNDFLALQGLPGAPTGGIPPAAIDQSAHAAVGAQAVLPPGGDDFVADVLVDDARQGAVDLAVETRINGQPRRFTYFDFTTEPRYMSDRAKDGIKTQATLEATTDIGFNLTYTALQKTSGRRIGIDRDEDGSFDRDELDIGSDTANSQDTAFVGASIPPSIAALNQFTLLSPAVSAVTPSSGKKAAINLQGGNYSGAITINKKVVLRKMVDPTTGAGVGGNVRIGTP